MPGAAMCNKGLGMADPWTSRKKHLRHDGQLRASRCRARLAWSTLEDQRGLCCARDCDQTRSPGDTEAHGRRESHGVGGHHPARHCCIRRLNAGIWGIIYVMLPMLRRARILHAIPLPKRRGARSLADKRVGAPLRRQGTPLNLVTERHEVCCELGAKVRERT